MDAEEASTQVMQTQRRIEKSMKRIGSIDLSLLPDVLVSTWCVDRYLNIIRININRNITSYRPILKNMESQFQLTSNEKKKSKYFAESGKMKLIG